MPLHFKIISFFIFLLVITGVLPAAYTDSQLLIGIVLVGLLSLSTVFFTPKNNFSITVTPLDATFLVFVVYGVIHYVFTSDFTFNYPLLWVQLSYLVLFYVFIAVKKQYATLVLVHTYGVSLVILGSLQMVLVLLQQLKLIPLVNTNFLFTGSFATPNLLAHFLSFAGVFVFWEIYDTPKKTMYLWKHIIMWTYFTASVIVIVLSESRTSWLALLLGVVIVGYFKKREYIISKVNKKVLLAFIALVGLLLVSGMLLLKKDSTSGRLFIAKLTTKEIMNAPVLGHGAFSFFKTYNTAKADYFLKEQRQWDEQKIAGNTCCAFNEYLNTTLEYGVLGLILVLLIVSQILYIKSKSESMSLGLAFFVMIMIIGLFSYPTKIPSIFISGIFGAAIIYTPQFSRTLVINLPIKKLVAIVIGGFFILFGVKNLWALTVFRTQKQATFKAKDIEKLKKLHFNTRFLKGSEFGYGEALFLLGSKKEGLIYMENEFNRLPDIYFAKKMSTYYHHQKQPKRVEQLLKYCIGNEPYVFEHRMKLAHFYFRNQKFKAATKEFEKIINLPIKIPSQQVIQYKEEAQKALKLLTKNGSAIFKKPSE